MKHNLRILYQGIVLCTWSWVCWVYRCPDEKQRFTFMDEKYFWWSRKDTYREKVSLEFRSFPLCNAWATLTLCQRNEKFSRPWSHIWCLFIKSMLSKHWVDNLIRLVMLIMVILYLHACYKMLPYFYQVGHVNYAQYGLCFLRMMHKLPGIVLVQFIKGEHVVHHQDRHWNGLWTDMIIGSTYMRHVKCPGAS